MKQKGSSGKFSAAFKTGAISFAFLIIGYQAALFIHQASVEAIVAQEGSAGHSRQEPALTDTRASTDEPAKASSRTSAVREEVVEKYARRSYESFPFDPNTATLEDLQRLGFSLKQAQSILNYRQAGGRFHRPSDFAKSFVVADSVYRRLEPFIRIPSLDINAADSTAFDQLPGIGPYYAAKMVEYREELQGYSFPEQLLDIWYFGQERLDGLIDLIEVGDSAPYPLWTLSEEELQEHPYLDRHSAHAIILFRENSPKEQWTVENLLKAGILDAEKGPKLARCRIASP